MIKPVNNPTQRHHELWRECITSLYEMNEPLKIDLKWRGEWKAVGISCDSMPSASWYESNEYRKTPPVKEMITRTITYPAPLRITPNIRSRYWAVHKEGIEAYKWVDDNSDNTWLKDGICYTNLEDAQARWDAEYSDKP